MKCSWAGSTGYCCSTGVQLLLPSVACRQSTQLQAILRCNIVSQAVDCGKEVRGAPTTRSCPVYRHGYDTGGSGKRPAVHTLHSPPPVPGRCDLRGEGVWRQPEGGQGGHQCGVQIILRR